MTIAITATTAITMMTVVYCEDVAPIATGIHTSMTGVRHRDDTLVIMIGSTDNHEKA